MTKPPINNNSANPKSGTQPTFTPEQLRQLLSLQNGVTQKKNTARSQKIMIKIANTIKNTQYYLDRFINFITKKTDDNRNDVVQTARSPILFGTYVIIFFVLVGGVWGSFAPLDSAATALGIVITSSKKKTIDHQEGGIITNIFVKQGDLVKQGDKIIQLDDTKIKASYEIGLSQYRQALAAENRLIAERDNQDKITFSELLLNDAHLPEVARIIQTQENLFKSKKEVYESEKNALHQEINQLNKKIDGIKAKKLASAKSLEVLKDRLKAMHSLHEKGFAHKAALLEMEAKEANVKSDIAMADTDIAGNKHSITKCEISIINLQNKYTEKTLTDLKEAQGQVAHYKEQVTAAKDSLNRVVVKSPVDGIINVLNFHTIGGVVPSGKPIVEISPTNDYLIIEAKVPSKNIDCVHEGLLVKIRFSAFKSRTTPLFTGKVVRISPDVVQDQSTHPMYGGGENFYVARIEIDMDEFNKFAKAKHIELHPGMQAEVQIVTGTRTLLRYMLDPITDTMFRAFKEK